MKLDAKAYILDGKWLNLNAIDYAQQWAYVTWLSASSGYESKLDLEFFKRKAVSYYELTRLEKIIYDIE